MERKQGPRLSPRIKAQLNQQDKPLVSQTEEKPLSTTEVQKEAVLDPISGGLEGSKHPQNCDKLDGETRAKSPNFDTENEPFVSSESGETDDFDEILQEILQPEAEMEIEAAEKRKSQADLAEILRESAEREPEVLARAMPEQRRKTIDAIMAKIAIPEDQEAKPTPLGPQPDGSFNIVVSIAEEYVEGVLQAAESAERTPNQWGSENFLFFLEGYFQPQKGR